ncbi:hypothetical protein BCR44DRAFT_77564 [Catenaria anguillulae PL171]|uniref:Uncharacterized protein n=1 Tax=Catenaria anguillulae PL171 TaxID=765915 RepID=A0A1Y2HKL3_9FUNG|nr:hypothetical protein BCR44DRAFT_77564 [Catenaria anguillulae PL171]
MLALNETVKGKPNIGSSTVSPAAAGRPVPSPGAAKRVAPNLRSPTKVKVTPTSAPRRIGSSPAPSTSTSNTLGAGNVKKNETASLPADRPRSKSQGRNPKRLTTADGTRSPATATTPASTVTKASTPSSAIRRQTSQIPSTAKIYGRATAPSMPTSSRVGGSAPNLTNASNSSKSPKPTKPASYDPTTRPTVKPTISATTRKPSSSKPTGDRADIPSRRPPVSQSSSSSTGRRSTPGTNLTSRSNARSTPTSGPANRSNNSNARSPPPAQRPGLLEPGRAPVAGLSEEEQMQLLVPMLRREYAGALSACQELLQAHPEHPFLIEYRDVLQAWVDHRTLPDQQQEEDEGSESEEGSESGSDQDGSSDFSDGDGGNGEE